MISLKLPVPTACFNISDKHPRHTLGECLHFRVGARLGRSAIGRVSRHKTQSNLGFFSSNLEYLIHRVRHLVQIGAGANSRGFGLLIEYVLPVLTFIRPLHELPIYHQHPWAHGMETLHSLLAYSQREILVTSATCDLCSYGTRAREMVFVAVGTGCYHCNKVGAIFRRCCKSRPAACYTLPWSGDLLLEGEIHLIAYLPWR